MIRGQVLGGARVMPTEEIFAAALRVQDSLSPSSVPPSTEVSVLVVTRGGPRSPLGRERRLESIEIPSLHAIIVGRCHIPLKMLEGVQKA